MTAKWRRYLRFWRPELGADVDDEIAFHVEERIEDLVARGMHPAAARDEAMRLFGDVQRIKHDCLIEALEERPARCTSSWCRAKMQRAVPIIPGTTGSAIDGDEGAPGPVMLQRQEQRVAFRNITVSVPRS